MKKYIVSLFVSSLILIPSLSFAVGPADDIGALSNLDCVNITNNLGYRDRDINKNGEVSTLQDFLQSKGYLNNEPTGYFGLLTVRAVKDFQRAYNISGTGYVGSITRAKIKDLTCGSEIIVGGKDEYGCIPSAGYTWCQVKNKCLRVWEEKCEITSSNNPVISGVSGPQRLNVNQVGTWKVSAYDRNGNNLSYSVDWGDNYYKACGGVACAPTSNMFRQTQQSATFTHTYSSPGTYNPIFTVTSENGIQCFTTPCPSNGGSVSTSLSVNVNPLICPQVMVNCVVGTEPQSYIGENGCTLFRCVPRVWN